MGISSVSFPGFWILPFKKLHAFITYIFNEIMGSWQLMERPPKWGCGGTMHSQLWTPQVVSRWARLQTVALQGWAVQGSWTSVSTPGKATIKGDDTLKIMKMCPLSAPFMLDFPCEHCLRHWGLTGGLWVGVGWSGASLLSWKTQYFTMQWWEHGAGSWRWVTG